MNIPSKNTEREEKLASTSYPQSTKNSSSKALDKKLLTLSNPANMINSPSTTTNAGNEGRSFHFSGNSSTTPQHKGYLAADEKVISKNDVQPSGRSTHQYYMTNLEKYLKTPQAGDEYFSKIYREHFMQTYQALNFCKYLKPVDPKELSKKKVYLPKRESHKGTLLLNYHLII